MDDDAVKDPIEGEEEAFDEKDPEEDELEEAEEFGVVDEEEI